MPRTSRVLECSEEARKALEKIVRCHKSEQRMVRRAKMILMCADGRQIKDIACDLGERPNTVSMWRDRFIEEGMKGLSDKQRSGKPATYGEDFRKKVLSKLQEDPPGDLTKWDGAALAEALSVSDDSVWRLLRKEGIQLSRQRTWCVSSDPNFAAKAAEVVGLYLDPPENAIVISVDEKPSIQALSRTTGYVKTRNSKLVRGIKSTYRRNGTQNLFAAIEVATGIVVGKATKNKKRADFLEFLDELLNDYDMGDGLEFHVIVDNHSIHKNCDEWLAKRGNVYFHYTPTSASWLNMIEIWFSIMSRKILRGASFDSTEQLSRAIERFIDAYNETAEPFIWRKREVNGTQ